MVKYGRKFCPEINFFKDAKFYSFRTILDSEMKRLKTSGLGIVKIVQPISFNSFTDGVKIN